MNMLRPGLSGWPCPTRARRDSQIVQQETPNQQTLMQKSARRCIFHILPSFSWWDVVGDVLNDLSCSEAS